MSQSGRGGENCLVAAVEGWAQQENCGDAATTWENHAASSGLSGRLSRVAVAQPFLQDLIIAESVGPDIGRDCTPESRAVQVDVEAGFARDREDFIQDETASQVGGSG